MSPRPHSLDPRAPALATGLEAALARRLPRDVRRLIGGVLLVQGALGLLFIAVQLLPDTAGRLQSKFQFDTEASVNTWWHILLLLSVGAAAFLVAHHRLVQRRLVRPVLVLAGVFVFLSIDEQIQLHETVGSFVAHTEGTLQWLWPVAYSPVLVGVAWAIYRVARGLPRAPRLLLMGGMALHAASILLEASATFYLDNGFLYACEVLVEETFEGVGAGLECAAFVLIGLPVLAPLWRRAGGTPEPRG